MGPGAPAGNPGRGILVLIHGNITPGSGKFEVLGEEITVNLAHVGWSAIWL